MPFRIVDSATRAACAAAANQQAQLEALIAPWAGAPVTARLYTTGGTLLRTITLPALTVAGSPPSITLGSHTGDTAVSTGTPGMWVFSNGATEIFRMDAGLTGALINHVGSVKTGCTPTLNGVVVTGNSALPPSGSSWTPPAEGTFADFGTSTLFSVRPSGWPNTEGAGPFANWSSAQWAPEYGISGGYVVHGSGHLTPGTALWAGVWVWDVYTQTWIGRNVPSSPLLEYGTGYPYSTLYNDYGESIVSGTVGHPYPPHTYTGLVYQPPSLGGGTNGSLLRAGFPGISIPGNSGVHRFRLNSATDAPTRVVDDLPLGGVSDSYVATAIDRARGGFWALPYNGAAPLVFVNFSGWGITQYAGIGQGVYGDHALIYLPAPYDMLVFMGRSDAGAVNWSYYASVITSGTPGAFAALTVSGTPPNNSRSGGVWSTLLSCIVSYQGGGSATVHKLTPPSAANARAGTGTWVWTSETLTGVGGATPTDFTGSGSTGMYSKFQEAPELQCFLLANSINAPMQAWRLTGM